MEGLKKRALSGAERRAKYGNENKEKVALNEAMKNFNRSELLQTGPNKAKAMMETAKRRKQTQRLSENGIIYQAPAFLCLLFRQCAASIYCNVSPSVSLLVT